MDSLFPEPWPIIVSYGLGVDSTALLVGLKRLGIRPTAILFSDVGNEKPGTYAYRPIIDQWLRENGFPPITDIRYVPKRFKNGPYNTLLGNCMVNKTLPGISFGPKSCSAKWKGQPMDKWVRTQFPGQPVYRLIGYDAGPKDQKRCGGVIETIDRNFHFRYPLSVWGWDREGCKAAIQEEGLPVPPKSACFFCAGTTKAELEEMCVTDPDLVRDALEMEANAAPNLRVIEGLWGRPIKGTRKPESRRPGSWTKYVNDNNLLPHPIYHERESTPADVCAE